MAATQNSSQSSLATRNVASEVTHLFRTKRVSEIRAYEKQIRQEAHEKSDSLRDLLGTRYKDLLKAADEISTIQEASTKHVRDALRSMATEAAHLRDVFQRQASQHIPNANTDQDRRRNVHEICETLKHIVDSPEVLYACLEEEKIYEAAMRYGLAARNYREVKNNSGLEGVANRFAERRWKQVSVFKKEILSAAEKQLVTPGLSSVVYSKVMASLILLAGDRDVISILDGFFAARTAWLEDETSKVNGPQESIRVVSRVLRETISCTADMFWKSTVENLLRDVDEEAAKEIANLMKDGSISGACHAWIGGVRSWLDDRCSKILDSAASSRALADILQSIDEVFEGDQWRQDCNSVLQQEPGFAFDLFKPFISNRAGVVASDCIENAVDKVSSGIEAVWTDLEIDNHAGKLIWSMASNQSVGLGVKSSGRATFVDNEKWDVDHISNMLSSNGQVSIVANVFESSLNDVLADVTALSQRIPAVSSPFDKAVNTYLPQILELLRKKLESIPSVFIEDSSQKEESCEYQMESALFIARIGSAFGNAKCVQSVYCFTTAGNGRVAKENESLSNFRRTAHEVSCDGYKAWANRLCLKLRKRLLEELTSEYVLNTCSGWSSESNENLRPPIEDSDSALRYPTTASTALVNYMLNACSAANRSGGFALPSEAIQYIRDELVLASVDVYGEALSIYQSALNPDIGLKEKNKTSMRIENSSNASLQMLFDVQVVQQLLGDSGASTKVSGNPKSLRALEGTIQATIDPIDLASCRKAMKEAVVTYTSRTGILFGTISRNIGERGNASKRPISSIGSTASANLVSLSRAVPRFTYLPAPMPSSYAVGSSTAGLNAKAAIGMLRNEASASANGAPYRKREADISVAGYASKVSESVSRFGRGFFESLTRTTES